LIGANLGRTHVEIIIDTFGCRRYNFSRWRVFLLFKFKKFN
jgi:hypothetical protein